MKQQKYQEALDGLRKECKATFVNEKGIRMYSSNKNDDERCNTIQQLIDKLPYWLELEERDKPVKIDENGLCGNCTASVNILNPSNDMNEYCGQCGHKIDIWSDDE